MEKITSSELARELAARRKRQDRRCDWCAELMVGVTARRRYCSLRCHDQAAYERKRKRARHVTQEPQP